MGQGGQCDGSIYCWIGGSGGFNFGVQCNGQGSSGSLATTTVAQPNTNYDLAFLYDGTTAKIYVNGVLDASAAKTFNYFASPTKITIGAGAFDTTSVETFSFGSIQNIIVDSATVPGTHPETWKLHTRVTDSTSAGDDVAIPSSFDLGCWEQNHNGACIGETVHIHQVAMNRSQRSMLVSSCAKPSQLVHGLAIVKLMGSVS